MNKSNELRWHQRYESFSKALFSLTSACARETYDELERAGLIQTFIFTYELSWKVMKDLELYEGSVVNSPREVIRQGFMLGYLDENDCESFLIALEKRNIFSHAYDEEEALEAEKLIKIQFFPMLERLHKTLEVKLKS